MRLLVLGGTRFLGRAVVADALARGWQVTTLTRGTSGEPPAGVEARYGDRTTPGGLAALDGGTWDAAVDTSGFVPRVVGESARALAGRVGHYVYVSSISAYPGWPSEPVGPATPVRECLSDAGPDDGDYGTLKAGCERAVAEVFGDASLAVRAGLIVGPYEDTGRLPWWLQRVARGGEVLAPGRPDRPVQLVDARDLASWLLRCAEAGTGGASAATGPPGSATLGEVLEACRDATGSGADLTWVPDEELLAAGVEPWTGLPLWLPESEAPHAWDVDVSAALATGLVVRPVALTVADTWEWLAASGPAALPDRGLPPVGIDAETERRVLAASRGTRRPGAGRSGAPGGTG